METSQTGSSPSTGGHVHPRSCQSCRSRKIKCDRQQPSCSSCSKAASLCEYPDGRGRAPKRPRRAVEGHVADRLSRLEALIRHLGQQSNSNASSLSAQRPQPADSQARPPDAASPSEAPAMDASFDERFSRLMIKETRSYYVSNVLWGNVADEVGTYITSHGSAGAQSV